MSLNEEDYGSDTDDEDYVPEGAENVQVSEEENSGDEENFVAKSTDVKKGNPAFRNGRNRVSDLVSDDKEEEPEVDPKKADTLWADFKKDTKCNKSEITKPVSSGGLASLFSDPPASKESNKLTSTSRFESLFDTAPKAKPAEESKPKLKNSFSDLFGDSNRTENTKIKDGKVEITKEYDFAGETVKVSKTVDADSKEASCYLKRPAASSGLSDLVGSLEKKKKLGCLDKSKLDWNSFVSENNIGEELKTFNKGKDGYVEKQQFLERADLRQFELEKAVRDQNRKSLMK